MNTLDPFLRLQAYVDGELSPDEARAVEKTLQADPAAAALVAELRGTCEALRQADPVRVVPETREFYWSQIRRRLDAGPKREPAVGRRWWAWLIPVGGVAVAAVVLSLPRTTVRESAAESGTRPMTLLAGNPAVTFHSDTDGVTIHWIQ